ncbi:hypothetical protein LUZ60_011079 [Juncus effusus]|nr:hypothetical protein LUZ60_011079 [Juncus effusus]
MGRNCEVCNEVQFKYKCPACLAPYCSVVCFKKHKENLCQKAQPPVEESNKTETSVPISPLENQTAKSHDKIKVNTSKTLEVENESWIVSKELLQSLVESKEVRDALKSKELQKLILSIDSSKEQEQELDKAMEGPVFREFSEKILDIISPRVDLN